MKMRYLEKLKTMGGFPIPWKVQSVVTVAMVGLLVILAAVVLFKPQVNSELHAEYLSNLNRMDALSGELHRDHLLVSEGLVSHYDFIEANLELMERSAELALFAPEFVNAGYDAQLTELLATYRADVRELRAAGRSQ